MARARGHRIRRTESPGAGEPVQAGVEWPRRHSRDAAELVVGSQGVVNPHSTRHFRGRRKLLGNACYCLSAGWGFFSLVMVVDPTATVGWYVSWVLSFLLAMGLASYTLFHLED